MTTPPRGKHAGRPAYEGPGRPVHQPRHARDGARHAGAPKARESTSYQGRHRQGPAPGAGAPGELRPAEVRRRQRAAEAAGRQRAARARSIAGAVRPSKPGKNYQPVILAEFTAAMLLTAITPIARKQRNTTTGGLSPYEGRDMVQLISLLVVYLILAFISAGSGRAARFSAWFGGLVAITVGLAGASEIAQVFNILAGGTVGATQAKKAAKTSSSSSGGAGSGNPQPGSGGGGRKGK